jgi:hypothetical protein
MKLATEAWGWLQRELDAWGECGLRADFWWRDDDAVAASPQLERLLGISERHAVPAALAVIPAGLHTSLAAELRNLPRVAVLQHGYAHHSHAAPGQRKLELGGNCDDRQLQAELRRGRQILLEQFGERCNAVLVPPWNRIDERILQALPTLGFAGVSAMRVRKSAWPAAGLLQVNTHLDPVNWRHRRGFIGVYPAIAILVQHLVARRTGYRDIDEPTGILSHHLVQNEAVWRFIDELFGFLGNHPASRWVDASAIWAESTR